LPLQFKSLLPGQEDCVFFSGNLNLHAKPETRIPYREKIITIKLKKDKKIILSDFIHQTTENYSFIHTTQYIYEKTPVRFSTLGTAGKI
jgi:hypothetical protein